MWENFNRNAPTHTDTHTHIQTHTGGEYGTTIITQLANANPIQVSFSDKVTMCADDSFVLSVKYDSSAQLHTHTHIYIYTYIYRVKEQERERERHITLRNLEIA